MAHLGMIAGAGELPEIIARRAHAEGSPLPTVALSTLRGSPTDPLLPDARALWPWPTHQDYSDFPTLPRAAGRDGRQGGEALPV